MTRARRKLAVAALLGSASCWLASCGQGSDHPPAALFSIEPDASTDGGPGSNGTHHIQLPSSVPVPDPTTCDEAATAHSYVGCDYWPTVLENVVWSFFDYAVVVSNPGTQMATLTITGPSSTNRTLTVAPGTLERIVLPWVTNLKGPDTAGSSTFTASVVEPGGAYHIVSSVPVVAYQFSALEYKANYTGMPNAESTLTCDGGTCFSFTNDASLLLPSTAWTQSYRVTGLPGLTIGGTGGGDVNGGYIAVTAAQNATNVTVALPANATVLGGGGIPATKGGGTVTRLLNAGDVMELVTPAGVTFDLSGALVTSDKPVEVFTGNPCVNIPANAPACDHIEESVVPAESLGKDYIVTLPTRPSGGAGLHVVRLYGNRDGTTLTYAPTKPKYCPDTLNAGDVADCGLVSADFIVQGTEEFGLSSFTVGATEYSPTDPRGDPDQTIFASALQYRTNYVFLAPADYDVNYAVVAGPSNANPVVDGQPLTGYTEIDSGYGVWRATLSAAGTHTLVSAQPAGLQVMGYGAYTSYTYPGGLSLLPISPPPVVR